MARINAPWTKEQVENLHEFQTCGYAHEFQCHFNTAMHPTENGWICGNFWEPCREG